ncbi:MAG TPA: hypothetical protein VM264_10665, partial [Acidimicrobiales bacterium]|nr:hypothetical protein [Acidimicrobiales bacterium]
MAGSPSAPRTHARTYEGIGPAAIVHRKRLAAIEQLLGRIEVGSSGEVADFGCSDGFILSVLQDGEDEPIGAAEIRDLARGTDLD